MSRNFELWTGQSSESLPAIVIPSGRDKPGPSRHSRHADVEVKGSEWLRVLEILKTRWHSSVLFAALVAATAIGVTFLMKTVYEPEARLEVDPPGAEIFSLQGHDGAGASADYVETQAQNLQSDGLALEVIRTLHLDQNRDFAGKAASGGETPALSGDTTIQLTPAESQALIEFNKSRKVIRDSASRLITVSVAAHDPAVAASATNTLVSLFIERDFKMRNDAIAQSTQWLQKQLVDIRQRMDESNRALEKLEGASGIGAIGENQNSFSERMVELQRQLMQAQADRIQLQAYLDKLNAVASSSLPQINSNLVVQQLTTRLAEARAELAQTQAVYGENHPNTKKLQNETNELQTQLNAQRTAILNDLKTSYTAAQAREHLMQSQMEGANKQMSVLAQYNALKKESDANTQLYSVLYQKIKEAAIAAETKSSNVRIVDFARILNRPTRPHRRQNIAFGLLGGLFGGLILAFLLEALDTRIHTPEDIKQCLGAETVSIMPVFLKGDGRYPLPHPGRELLVHKASGGMRPFLLDRPNSPESEALRGIYTAVRLSWRNQSGARVLLIASPLSGEGKTTLSVNLAVALAQHASTCIVDADLRKAGVGPTLGVASKRGLGDVLSGKMELDDALVPNVHLPGLTFLPAGSVTGDPGRLIASSAMGNLIATLKQRFEFVVIDSPPILPVADARSLSVLADGIVMVGRAGTTTRANLKRATEMLREIRSAPILEIVLNAAEYPVVNYGYYNYGASETA